MANDSVPFMSTFGQVNVDQITESRISTVISMLPTSLQSGMAPIRFLRRSISLHSLRSAVLVSEPRRKPRPLSETNIPTLTREPIMSEMLDQDRDSDEQYSDSQSSSPRRKRHALRSEAADDDRSVRAASGVHWRFARQGSSLVNIAIDGDQPAVTEDDTAFERKAFVDGVTYLLKALPQDLDLSEASRIQSALPSGMATPRELVAVQPGVALGRGAPTTRSVLHRGVQLTVVNCIVLISFLMPYFLCLVRYLAQVERKYRVSESLVANGKVLVGAIGKKSIQCTETIGQMNDGRVGQTFLELLTWTVDGVTGGIHDGLGEGLSLVGAKNTMRA